MSLKRSFEKGNLLNWNTAQWTIYNMTETTVESDILCTGADLGNTLIPGKWDIDDSRLLCNQMGGKTSVVGSRQEQEEITAMFLNHTSCTIVAKLSGGTGMLL